MHLSKILVDELAQLRKRADKDKLDIVETGTIRGETDNYRANDGWSTLTFAEQVKEHGGSMTSIDLNIATCDTVLRDRKLRSVVKLIQGHSLEVLAGMLEQAEDKGKLLFDVALLDSDNDGELIFNEFLLVKDVMRSPGLIIVDDVDLNSDGVVKGHQILPWVQQQDVPHRLLKRTGDGYSTGVLVIEV